MPKAQKAVRKTQAEWEEQLPNFKKLRDANWDVNCIAAQMLLVHQFDQEPDQYKNQFKNRKMRKYLKREELRKLCAYDRGRRELGKTSSIYSARKRQIQPSSMKRHIKEHGEPEARFVPPSITSFECATLEYSRDNPHISELINGSIEPYSGFDGASEYTFGYTEVDDNLQSLAKNVNLPSQGTGGSADSDFDLNAALGISAVPRC